MTSVYVQHQQPFILTRLFSQYIGVNLAYGLPTTFSSTLTCPKHPPYKVPSLFYLLSTLLSISSWAYLSLHHHLPAVSQFSSSLYVKHGNVPTRRRQAVPLEVSLCPFQSTADTWSYQHGITQFMDTSRNGEWDTKPQFHLQVITELCRKHSDIVEIATKKTERIQRLLPSNTWSKWPALLTTRPSSKFYQKLSSKCRLFNSLVPFHCHKILNKIFIV